MSAKKPGADPASVASSASTVILVGPGTVPDEEELYAAIRRGSSRKPTFDGSSTGSDSPPGSPSGNGGRGGGSNGTSAQFALETDIVKHSTSMSSSVRAHVYEGGMRYHAFRDGKYPFPNDETEQNRDDMKHHMSLLLCQGEFFLSPVADKLKAGGEVLDLGKSPDFALPWRCQSINGPAIDHSAASAMQRR